MKRSQRTRKEQILPMNTLVVFMLGLLFGWLGGTSVTVHRSVLDAVGVAVHHPTDRSNVPSDPVNNNGWKSINVFYGSTDLAESLLDSNKKWFSQARQDEAIFALLRNKTEGFFVDLAANDATILSNTYALERFHDWKGICIEPNPIYWYNLTHYRPNCQLVGAVVGERRSEPVHFYYSALDHGGIAGNGFDNGAKFQKDSLQEYTVTLLEILERYNAPKTIDYLSLDIEGAEEFIMRTFPLQKYTIKLMTIERPKEELREFLDSNGYQQIQRLSRWGETLWAHKNVYSELDVSRLDEFHGKNQHMAQKAARNENQ